MPRIHIHHDFRAENRWEYARDMFLWIVKNRDHVKLYRAGVRIYYEDDDEQEMKHWGLTKFGQRYAPMELEGPDDFIMEFKMRFEGSCPK